MRSQPSKPFARKLMALLILVLGISASLLLTDFIWENFRGVWARREGGSLFSLFFFGGGSILMAMLYYDHDDREPYSKRLRSHCNKQGRKKKRSAKIARCLFAGTPPSNRIPRGHRTTTVGHQQ
ncbi:MAG: hypothetical protein ACYTGH_19230 [Planctomycetota bacterium]|jgi:hypothetical protein